MLTLASPSTHQVPGCERCCGALPLQPGPHYCPELSFLTDFLVLSFIVRVHLLPHPENKRGARACGGSKRRAVRRRQGEKAHLDLESPSSCSGLVFWSGSAPPLLLRHFLLHLFCGSQMDSFIFFYLANPWWLFGKGAHHWGLGRYVK